MASARARPISGVVTAAGGPMIFLIMALKSPLSSAIARLVRSSSRSSLLSPTNTPVFSIPFDDAPNPTMRGIASNARFLYSLQRRAWHHFYVGSYKGIVGRFKRNRAAPPLA
eukprot:COSAG06_NODE_32953_length_497_cov_1.552764_1_plen_112_part_00